MSRPRCHVSTCPVYHHLTAKIVAADKAKQPNDQGSYEALVKAMLERDAHVLCCSQPRARR